MMKKLILKGKPFVEEKWFQNTRSFFRCSKSLFKQKEAPKFIAHWRL